MGRLQTKFHDICRIDSTRLTHHNYSSPGSYFITICTFKRESCFGEIVDNTFQGNELSTICTTCWFDLPNHYDNCELDSFVIMPNHVHGIVIIKNDCRDGACPVSTIKHKNILGHIVGSFKSAVTKYVNMTNIPFHWQSRFYDHVIRNEEELHKIREYIANNPMNWKEDRNNINNISERRD